MLGLHSARVAAALVIGRAGRVSKIEHPRLPN
jgi:hypothetical protein